MTDHDDVLKELDAALRVEPSRAFAAGVRTRVTRSHTTIRRMWFGLAAAASVGLATMALWRPSVEAPVEVAVAREHAIAPAIPYGAPGTGVAIASLATAAPPAGTRRATVARSAIVSTASEPGLEVITNQGALLRELWAGVRNSTLLEAAIVATPVTAAEVKPITPIVVEPIVVAPLVWTQIGKEPGRDGATPVIRRVDATRETR